MIVSLSTAVAMAVVSTVTPRYVIEFGFDCGDARIIAAAIKTTTANPFVIPTPCLRVPETR
jgi:hypothetical protein